MTKVGILTIGSEILDGRILDSNSNFLAKELRQNDYEVSYKISCGDDLAEIISAFNFFFQNGVDFVITSGGLGPTGDDLTREAIAEFLALELKEDSQSLEKLKQRYKKIGKTLPQSNLKQAIFPEGAEIIVNEYGTANAFFLPGEKAILALPGVPKELKGIFADLVLDRLKRDFPTSKKYQSSFSFFGITESSLCEQIEGLNLADGIEIIYQTSYPENKVILRSDDEERLNQSSEVVRSNFPSSNLFSEASLVLSEVVHQELITKNKTIAFAESCTAGLISSTLANYSGSSKYLLGSAVTYSNQSKEKLLGVSAETLKQFGAVSEDTALEMAKGALELFGSDIALSVTGIAGPDGGSEEKPVGTVYFGLATKESAQAFHLFHPSSRDKVRLYSAHYAFNLIRTSLSDNP